MNPRKVIGATKSRWVYSDCCLCNQTAGEDILLAKHRDAPGGRACLRQCSGCGLKRLWPRPGSNVISTYYPSDTGAYIGRHRSALKQAAWDFVRDVASGAPGRGRDWSSLRPVFKALATRLFDTNVPLDRDPLPSIIDIGCGFGDLLLYWKSRGVTAVGVDFSDKAVSMGKSLGLHILLGELEEQNFPAESFDVAVLNHSLEHVNDPLLVLKETASILRPGGTIHIAVPNGASTGFEIYKDAWQFLTFPLHCWFFDCETLAQCLYMAGFHELSVRTSNFWRGYVSAFKLAACLQWPQMLLAIFLLFVRTNFHTRHNGDILRIVAVKK